MVIIASPPPVESPQPIELTLAAGTPIFRLYDPAQFDATAMRFRYFGPLSRFDHQMELSGSPSFIAKRGVLYAGNTFSGCVAEIFGDRKVVDVGTWEVAVLEPTRDLKLMDLGGDGALRAGTVSAVCKDSLRSRGQEWSRYFYENVFLYSQIDGLTFENAQNDEQAFAFYERCENSFKVLASGSLKEPAVYTKLQLIAAKLRMVINPLETAN